MKKKVGMGIFAAALLVALGAYYYIALPAVNIHSVGFWQCLLFFILAFTIGCTIVRARKIGKKLGKIGRAHV